MTRKTYKISEEILQRGIIDNPNKIGKFFYYNIGATTVGSLRACNLIQDRDYKVDDRKPDGLIVDETKRVLAVIENKSLEKYKTEKQRNDATEQAFEVAVDLGAKFVISTDSINSNWFSVFDKQPILNSNNTELKEVFGVTTCNTPKMEKLIDVLDKTITPNCRQITQVIEIYPTPLALSIWQKIYQATAATPENCLYTFVEIFIFKYLSDLNVLNNLYSFNYLMKMYENTDEDTVLSFYAKNIRPQIKKLFPPSIDGTTIVNGTIFVNESSEDAITGYGKTFRNILDMFKDVELKNIDKDFKSKIFEVFFKTDNQKGGMGQYFTPLKVVQQLVNMADIRSGMRICDPACGVGKFILEAIVKDINKFYKVENNKLIKNITIEGFDKGFTKDSERTIILAKANMLIYFSDIIKNNPKLTKDFSDLFNETFHLKTSVLGTLEYVPSKEEKYDIIFSNPPYLGNTDVFKKEIFGKAHLESYYNKNGNGLEGLFVEWIIRSLAEDGQAFIIIPEGFMYRINDTELRKFMLEACIIEGVISLPLNTFFSTNKKTYILCLKKKKENEKVVQSSPVFTYLCSSIGETLDINRFNIDDNDLADAAYEYHSFKGNKEIYKERYLSQKINNPRLKVLDVKYFIDNANKNWNIDNNWSDEEKIALGIKEQEQTMSINEFSDFIGNVIQELSEFKRLIENV